MPGSVSVPAGTIEGMVWVQVCLNGARGTADGASIPMSPQDMARSAADAVAAGARDVHVHPKTPCGHDTVSPRAVAATVQAVRSLVTVPVGVTTGAWAEPSSARRLADIRSWTVLPDHASVNWHEEGAEEVASVLLEMGVGVEAGLWSGTDGPARFRESPLRGRVLRILAEVTDPSPETAAASAEALLAEIGTSDGLPVLLHGEEGGAWPVLRVAVERGLTTRVGLEDTLTLPDGRRARDNAELVAQVRKLAS